MNVAIIGTGYVGLVMGACLAEMGNQVLCVDLDSAKIRLLNENGIPIFEPGLEQVIRRNRDAGRLKFTTDVGAGVDHGVIQVIAVGTPAGDAGLADLQHVLAAVRAIGQHLDMYRVVVDKSTVPVGTADKVRAAVAEELARRGVKHEFSVVSNPEFLKEGAAVENFMRPDRIIVGSDDERATRLLRKFYAPFQRNRERLMLMSVRSADLTKYAANAMLATRIWFMNELANLAERLGTDLTGRCFALWGLAFKPNTDDMREAPSRTLVADLLAAGASVQAYDPGRGSTQRDRCDDTGPSKTYRRTARSRDARNSLGFRRTHCRHGA